MRRLLVLLTLVCFERTAVLPAWAQNGPTADLAEAAKANLNAAGQAASAAKAAATLPGYTETPPQLVYAGRDPAALQAAAQAHVTDCAAQTDDPACQGEGAARKANATPRAALDPGTVADVSAAKGTIRNPGAVLGSLASYYSGCSQTGICPTSQFCFGVRCFDISAVPDPDFAQTMSYLEAAREAGIYLDPASLHVFAGEDNRCGEELLNNCCTSHAKGKDMSNGAMTGAGSRLVFDILMNSNNRRFIMAGLKALASSAGLSGDFTLSGITFTANPVLTSPGLPVLAGGDGWVITFDPLTASMTVVVLVAMSMMNCPQEEVKTSFKEGAGLCLTVPPARRCVKRVLGICYKWETTKCCYNSLLARIINQQGRTQLGLGWGTNKRPLCDGFTVAQLQTLDFSKIDLTEFYASIVPDTPDRDKFTADALAKSAGCYYGSGKCNTPGTP